MFWFVRRFPIIGLSPDGAFGVTPEPPIRRLHPIGHPVAKPALTNTHQTFNCFARHMLKTLIALPYLLKTILYKKKLGEH